MRFTNILAATALLAASVPMTPADKVVVTANRGTAGLNSYRAERRRLTGRRSFGRTAFVTRGNRAQRARQFAGMTSL